MKRYLSGLTKLIEQGARDRQLRDLFAESLSTSETLTNFPKTAPPVKTSHAMQHASDQGLFHVGSRSLPRSFLESLQNRHMEIEESPRDCDLSGF